MMLTETAQINLERAYVDVYGMGPVLEALARIAMQKSEHAAEQWQDAKLAEAWARVVEELNKVQAYTEGL